MAFGFKEHSDDWRRFNDDASLVEKHSKWTEIHTDADGNRCIEFDESVFRRVDDCIISIGEDRLSLCISEQENVILPDGIRSLAPCSVDSRWCPNVKHLVIPASVQSISNQSLVSGTLQTVTILNPDIAVSPWVWDGCPALETVECPPLGKVFPLIVKSMYVMPVNPPADDSQSPIMDMDDEDLPF